jgi:hypothetical protein
VRVLHYTFDDLIFFVPSAAMDECVRNLKKAARFRRPAPQAKKKLMHREPANICCKEDGPESANFPPSMTAAQILPPAMTSQQQNIQELQKMYLFGLLEVSLLEELQKAPDAILYGNFCGTGSTISKSKPVE